ncbi:MAG: Glycerophosphoryl diester phosphodiesterase [Planctomycetota bacterium]|jgi:glycerophosphoryl diester phosphodiesterase
MITPLLAAAVLAMPIDDSNPTPRLPAIVGHRGAAAHAPENTLASFRLGFEHGADAVEGDFWLTRDGRIVAMHDRDLHRTTGDPRAVADVTLEEIRTLDAGSWGDWKEAGFAGEPVPTLEEVLAIVPAGRGVLIEIKDSPRIVEALVAALDAATLETHQVTVISFDADVIASLKRRAPTWKAFWLTSFKERDGAWQPSVADVIATAQRIQADGVDVKAEPKVVDESFAKSVREAGLELHVWTVNDVEVARRMAEIGVDSITTDRPREIREGVGRIVQRGR